MDGAVPTLKLEKKRFKSLIFADFSKDDGPYATITTNICLQGGIPAWRIRNALLSS